MKISDMCTVISAFMMLVIVWLHAATYGEGIEPFPPWQRAIWGIAVPWFFINSMIWMAVKWRGFEVELGRRVRSLIVPYFCWCVLGAVWSIALHGIQFEGLDLLRYIGLHPWKDPAYQPMWFIRNLTLVLLIEGLVLKVLRIKKIDSRGDCGEGQWQWIRHLIFPIYVIHSMWLSVARLVLGKLRFEGVELTIVVIVAVGLSILSSVALKKITPRFASVLLGGR